MYKAKPPIRTDVLRDVGLSIRNNLLRNGGELLFQTRLSGLLLSEYGPQKKRLAGIVTGDGRKLETENLIASIGHSARDTFRSLYEGGVHMTQKPFSVGVRIEHPQTMINEAQYGEKWKSYGLGAADYKLSYHCQNGRGVYTFCMCPGGYVIGAASKEGCVVTNGMSYHDRGSALANSALLVDVRTEDFPSDSPLAGVEFQEKYERLAFQTGGSSYCAPAQRLGDFMKGSFGLEHADSWTEPTYRPGVVWAELSHCLPKFAVEAMQEAIPELGKKLKGFDRGDAVMTGVETRSSSPVRINRNEELMSNIEGLYPAGEGAGYAGGIMSAAVDGIRVAEQIVTRYKSFR